MKHPVLLAVLALAGLATAQGFGFQPMPQSLPGTPMTPPPVNHPALAGQPLFQPDPPRPATSSPKEEPEEGSAARPMRKPVDPDTVGPKLAGKDLKKVVKAVASLKWGEKLFDARGDSAASGKPILLVQALGKIDGLA